MQLSRIVLNSILGFVISANAVLIANDYDYIVVGLGTAGAVAARYLSDAEDGAYKNSVLVIEAGENYSEDPIITG
jgi:choline dehydrogenase-like flavoprotein